MKRQIYNLILMVFFVIITCSCKKENTSSTLTNYTEFGLINKTVYALAIDAQGNKWVGTQQGISRFDGKNWTAFTTANSGLINNWINSIVIDANGNKWIGTWTGLSKFDGTNWTSYFVGNSIAHITLDAQDNLWFSQYDTASRKHLGVVKFDGINSTNYSASNSGLPCNDITSIAIDALGNKWFGTWNDTVGHSGKCWITKYDDVNWTSINIADLGLTEQGFSYFPVDAIAIDAQGNKWLGSDGSGVSKFDNTNFVHYTIEDIPDGVGYANNSVLAIAIDLHGNKWFGTRDGARKFDGTSWTNYSTYDKYDQSGDTFVYTIVIDKQGNIWFGTDNGIYVYNEN
jgi:ligand-binding sensor domain-containing protein